tara:strand:- start:258 stop:452 length:195 start_codon:yes stop_codon:yes gene_type:complete
MIEMNESYITVHAQWIEDESGDVVDSTYYCSDSCHQFDDDYSGWNGCNEVMAPEWCAQCGDEIS